MCTLMRSTPRERALRQMGMHTTGEDAAEVEHAAAATDSMPCRYSSSRRSHAGAARWPRRCAASTAPAATQQAARTAPRHPKRLASLMPCARARFLPRKADSRPSAPTEAPAPTLGAARDAQLPRKRPARGGGRFNSARGSREPLARWDAPRRPAARVLGVNRPSGVREGVRGSGHCLLREIANDSLLRLTTTRFRVIDPAALRSGRQLPRRYTRHVFRVPRPNGRAGALVQGS
jgi:hypothetical protein